MVRRLRRRRPERPRLGRIFGERILGTGRPTGRRHQRRVLRQRQTDCRRRRGPDLARLGLARLTWPYRPSGASPARRSAAPGSGRAGRRNQANRGRTVMRTNKTRLGVERLDEREVPACIVAHPTPDTVVITGDGANDTVLIRDNGFGGISGGATGAGAFSFAGIKKIQVSTNGGSDRVSYTLFRDLQPGQSRDVFVSLGSSPRGTQDTFVANLYNPVTGVGS